MLFKKSVKLSCNDLWVHSCGTQLIKERKKNEKNKPSAQAGFERTTFGLEGLSLTA